MQFRTLRTKMIAAAVICLLAMPLVSYSAPVPKSTDSGSAAATAKPVKTTKDIVSDQDRIAARFRRFENTLRQMAQYLQKTEPERAELLRRAFGKSREAGLARQMQSVMENLKSGRMGDALDQQAELVAQLQTLLTLLQSEDAARRNKAEQARIKDLLKDLNRIIGKQKDNRAGTERGDGMKRLAGRQAKIADKTQRLQNKIAGQDAARNAKPGDGKSGKGKDGKGKDGKGKDGKGKDGKGKDGKGKDGKGKPGAGKPGAGKPGAGKPGAGKPGAGKPGAGKPGAGKPGAGKPGAGKPGAGKPGAGKPGAGKPGQNDDDSYPNKTPGRKDLEQARRNMERAIKELKEKNRNSASDAQDRALQKLLAAKEKLEEILRQLREKERERLLAALEARFQKMLAMQVIVYAGTVNLGKTKKSERTSRHFARSRELSQKEKEIAVEAAKALTLLQEEGSSVAFPEAVRQLRLDMLLVAQRLERVQVEEITQETERDIIEALNEMIEALQKEMEKMKDKKKKGKPKKGQPKDPALVEILAELKMLRSLQMRINRRTKRLGRRIKGDQATDADILDLLKDLAKRQAPIQEATYNLASGRNK